MRKSTSIIGITLIVFLILKLTHTGIVATWSWVWIFSPIWLPPSFFISLSILVAISIPIINKVFGIKINTDKFWKIF